MYLEKNSSDTEILEFRYYTGIKEDDEKMMSFLQKLSEFGITTIPKPLKKIRLNSGDPHPLGMESEFLYKANFDIEITTDILLDKTKVDEIILFSGDSDFAYLTKKLKDQGKRVIVYSSKKTISWELKLSASQVIYFENLKEFIQR